MARPAHSATWEVFRMLFQKEDVAEDFFHGQRVV